MYPVAISNLSLSYKTQQIFDDTELNLTENCISGILGRNGSGKTTLFDIICGLRNAPSGRVNVLRDELAYLSQTVWVPPALCMGEVFYMINSLASGKRLGKKEVYRKLESWSPELAARFDNIWQKKSAICSYGEIRCFFTLSLVATDSRLIILDEPTAGVDPEFRHYIWMALEHARSEGATLLISSHNTDEIARHCDFFYMISHKKLKRFDNDEGFMKHFGASTLDEAFINANTLHP